MNETGLSVGQRNMISHHEGDMRLYIISDVGFPSILMSVVFSEF